jgi:hypothetical protein
MAHVGAAAKEVRGTAVPLMPGPALVSLVSASCDLSLSRSKPRRRQETTHPRSAVQRLLRHVLPRGFVRVRHFSLQARPMAVAPDSPREYDSCSLHPNPHGPTTPIASPGRTAFAVSTGAIPLAAPTATAARSLVAMAPPDRHERGP